MNLLASAKTAKLPKWAQEEFANIKRERDLAVKELNSYIDTQTPSCFRVDELVCTGEERGPSLKRRYIQAREIVAVAGDVELSIRVRNMDGRTTIDLQWGIEMSTTEVPMIPESFQRVRLVAKENLR